MSTEFYPLVARGFEYEDYNTWGPYLGCRGGLGEGKGSCFVWELHPELSMYLVHAAGGARDAWGKVYTLEEFEAMLRLCRIQDCHTKGWLLPETLQQFLARLDPSLLKVQHGQGNPSSTS